MNVYLAARYSRRLELCAYKADLEDVGHLVTSRWLLGERQLDAQGQPIGAAGEAAIEAGLADPSKFAEDCIEDVRAADVLVAFTEAPGTVGGARGGRHVELGLALAWCLEVIVVGPRENLFCWMKQVRHFDAWCEDLARHLRIRSQQLDEARWRRLP